jgi:hypothetical protein
MLIHWQNSYAPSSKQRIGHHEVQSYGPGPHTKNPPYIILMELLLGLNDFNFLGRKPF